MKNVMTPDEIADRGERIYQELFQNQYEGDHNGKYLAIDIENKKAYLGEHSEDALAEAEKNTLAGLYI